MATTTTNFGWDIPQSTDLVKDGATAIAALGQDIDTALVDLKGGTTGQVLAKASNTDLDYSWVAQDDSNAIQNAIVDAKGDLIAASAADTPARLAIGNNGETLIADSSTSTGLRYQALKGKNCIYNSAMQVWQRGTSFSVLTAGGEYTADRWYAAFSGIAGRTLSRQTGTGQFQYLMRVARDSGNTNTTGLQLGQSLEIADATLYAGQTVTLSYYARKGANYSATSDALVVNIFSGTSSTEANRITTAYASGGVTDLAATTTLTSTLTRFSHTITFGASVTQFAIKFTFTPTGTAGAADYYEIGGVQLEVGSVNTTFSPMGGTIQGELAACQRYFRSLGYGVMGACISATTVQLAIYHPSMRTTPTFAAPSPIQISDMISTSFTQSSTSISIIAATQEGSWLSLPNFTGMTTGRPATLNTTTGISLSAEL
jgi:type II secretory pathway component PulM